VRSFKQNLGVYEVFGRRLMTNHDPLSIVSNLINDCLDFILIYFPLFEEYFAMLCNQLVSNFSL
jgi:hypothetical protein